MTRSGRIAVSSLLLLLVASCGDSGGFPLLGVPTSSVSTTATGVTTTTGGTEVTNGGSTTSTTADSPDPFSVEGLQALEPGPLPELTGTASILGASPDEGLALALTAELEATGLDLTGTRIEVRPVTGTGESLLVFWIDDTAIALGEEDDVTEVLLGALLDSPIVDGAAITRFVINYRSEDEDGPFVLTATSAIADMRVALETGQDLAEEQMGMQFTRLEAP